MKKCYLDSNILINLKNTKSSFHKKTKELLVSLVNNSYNLCISSLVLDEFLHQFQHILKFQKKRDILKKVLYALESVMSLPKLKLVNPPLSKKNHLKIVGYMKDYNLLPRDAYHFLIMKENKIGYFATFDKDFREVFREGKINDVFSVI